MKQAKMAVLFIILAILLAGCVKPRKSTPPVTQSAQETAEAALKEQTIDFSDDFDGIKGCAVFYKADENQVFYYNKTWCNERRSPYSTFKIVSTLMGLKNGVLQSEETKLGYDGTKYSMDMWNADLTMKEAFQYSCVWYYKKVIDLVGKDEAQKELKALDYGNCDISQWNGSGKNEIQKLNGFWLDSSLEITPFEETQVIAKIFEGESEYTKAQIDILKDIMFSSEENGISIYGKTGTGFENEAWFAGFCEKNDKRTYFAVYLNDPEQKESIAGVNAKDILTKIVSDSHLDFQ